MHRHSFIRQHTTIGVLLLLAATLARVDGPLAAAADANPLAAAYQDAERLAKTPGGLDQAIAKYRAVVETHRANEKLYQSSLRQLARHYQETGRAEEGVRFFLGLVQQSMTAARQDVLRDVIQQFALKHPDLMKRIAEELGLTSAARPRPIQAAPSEELAKAILQREDKSLRDKALDEIGRMLAPASPDQSQRRALVTLRRALSAKFERGPLRSLVVPLLQSQDPQVRALAVEVLPGLEAAAEDLPKIAALAADPSPSVRGSVGSALILIGKGQHKEQVLPALLKLLRDEKPEVIEQTIRSMWGQYSSPEFDALLIELSRNPRFHHNAIYFSLSTMRPKSVAVCRRLVEELSDPDWNNSGRAAWGLTYGVVDEARTLVEEGLLKAIPEETNAYTRGQEFRALRQVASGRSREYLKKVADSPQETEQLKQLAREILADVDKPR